MSIKKLLYTLHPFERKILPLLKTTYSFSELVQKTSLKEVEAMRALEWLENKKIITLKKTEQKIIRLEKNGKFYQKHGLPEKRFLKVIEKSPKSLQQIQKIGKVTVIMIKKQCLVGAGIITWKCQAST